jgi:transposase
VLRAEIRAAHEAGAGAVERGVEHPIAARPSDRGVSAQGTALRKRRDRNRVASDRTLVTGTSAVGVAAQDRVAGGGHALFYIARTGCQWRLLPGDFPRYSTVQRYFYAWRDDGTLQRINFELLVQAREAANRQPSPSAGVIDSQ